MLSKNWTQTATLDVDMIDYYPRKISKLDAKNFPSLEYITESS